ncbi:hypothetical protein ES708_24428 [subsurface metagenome]
MPGEVTITEQTHKMIKKVTFDWTTTTGGQAWGHSTVNNYDGEVLRIVCKINSLATDGYSVIINDSDNFDLLGGQGTISTGEAHDFGTSTGIVNTPLSVVSGKLSLKILNAIQETTGQTIVYIR